MEFADRRSAELNLFEVGRVHAETFGYGHNLMEFLRDRGHVARLAAESAAARPASADAVSAGQASAKHAPVPPCSDRACAVRGEFVAQVAAMAVPRLRQVLDAQADAPGAGAVPTQARSIDDLFRAEVKAAAVRVLATELITNPAWRRAAADSVRLGCFECGHVRDLLDHKALNAAASSERGRLLTCDCSSNLWEYAELVATKAVAPAAAYRLFIPTSKQLRSRLWVDLVNKTAGRDGKQTAASRRAKEYATKSHTAANAADGRDLRLTEAQQRGVALYVAVAAHLNGPDAPTSLANLLDRVADRNGWRADGQRIDLGVLYDDYTATVEAVETYVPKFAARFGRGAVHMLADQSLDRFGEVGGGDRTMELATDGNGRLVGASGSEANDHDDAQGLTVSGVEPGAMADVEDRWEPSEPVDPATAWAERTVAAVAAAGGRATQKVLRRELEAFRAELDSASPSDAAVAVMLDALLADAKALRDLAANLRGARKQAG